MTTFFQTQLLPQLPSADLESKLAFVHPEDHEDVIQEAWLAHLEGRDPASAMNTFAVRERRHRQQERTGILS